MAKRDPALSVLVADPSSHMAALVAVMLRSIGIPARMAGGFTQGSGAGRQNEDVREFDALPNRYTVQKKNAHAWPEVYFPGIGWVEFEPTGNQPTLDRPLPPRDPNDIGNLGFPLDSLREEDSNFDPSQAEEPLPTPAETVTPISPLLYLIPLAVAALFLAFYFVNRRYPLATHLPVLVRASMERTGFEVPKWIYHWEYWGHLSPIERAFESVNFGLRILSKPLPVHTTPIERAKKLTNLLPKMSDQIKVLLDEHQTSLYTSRNADVIQARRAAFDLRKEVILERIRYVFVGNSHGD